jgi:hypothetical protein
MILAERKDSNGNLLVSVDQAIDTGDITIRLSHMAAVQCAEGEGFYIEKVGHPIRWVIHQRFPRG